eukprot:4871715-Lingulodinium_polyedra.AAC.1
MQRTGWRRPGNLARNAEHWGVGQMRAWELGAQRAQLVAERAHWTNSRVNGSVGLATLQMHGCCA